MKQMFERLKALGEAQLEDMKQNRIQENVQLDFKRKEESRSGAFSKTDKRNFGEALSAFANSMGGLLVFGATARKDSDQVDALSELNPIDELTQFASHAQTLVGQILLPRHPQIEIVAIPTVVAPSRGYLAVWIDRSERRPVLP